VNKNLRVGIQTGVSFGLAMGLLAIFRTGRLAPALINAASGIFFGATMAWFSSRGERRLKAKGIDAADLSPVQSRTVSYPGHLQEAIDATRQALQLVRKIKVVKATSNPPSLDAKTGFTFDSFGENIVAEFSPSPTGTEVRVSSKPRISTTEMDMGKGVENVETIVRFLEERGATRRVA
jgi:hypothetical protein